MKLQALDVTGIEVVDGYVRITQQDATGDELYSLDQGKINVGST